VALDYNTGDTLVMGAVTEAPKLDGVLDDAVWKTARPVFVKTMQGANLRGTGESLVEIRAVHDDSLTSSCALAGPENGISASAASQRRRIFKNQSAPR